MLLFLLPNHDSLLPYFYILNHHVHGSASLPVVGFGFKGDIQVHTWAKLRCEVCHVKSDCILIVSTLSQGQSHVFAGLSHEHRRAIELDITNAEDGLGIVRTKGCHTFDLLNLIK